MSLFKNNVVCVINVSVLLIGIFGLTTSAELAASLKVTFKNNTEETSDRSFEECWSDANFTCIKSIISYKFKDMWKEKEIKLMDSVVIEKIANLSSDDNEIQEVGYSTDEGRSYNSDADKLVENVGKFVRSHALKIDLWNFATLRIGRSVENPDNLEMVFDMNKGHSEAKSNRMWKIIVPLVLGFKTTGALIFAISAVKLFLLKALVVSKIALLAAGFLVAKKLLSSMGGQHHPHLSAHQPLPYFHDHGLDGGLSSGYGYSMGAAGMGGHYGGSSGHGYGASGSGGLSSSGGDDLQAHFSNNILTAANQTASRKNGNKWMHKYYKYH